MKHVHVSNALTLLKEFEKSRLKYPLYFKQIVSQFALISNYKKNVNRTPFKNLFENRSEARTLGLIPLEKLRE
jgi:hypothetical protein